MEEINQVYANNYFIFLIIKANLMYNYIPQCVIDSSSQNLHFRRSDSSSWFSITDHRSFLKKHIFTYKFWLNIYLNIFILNPLILAKRQRSIDSKLQISDTSKLQMISNCRCPNYRFFLLFFYFFNLFF
jgi:hypothetical protein